MTIADLEASTSFVGFFGTCLGSTEEVP